MAKKKSTIEEAIVTPQEPELDYKKDLENKSFEQVAQTPPDAPAVEDKTEEKTDEVIPDKPAEEFETVEFDPEQLKKDAVEEATKQIQESLKGETKVETKEKKDEYVEFQKAVFEKEGRNPTYKEALDFVRDQAITAIRDDQAARETKAREDQEAATKAQTAQQESTNKYINDTLNELYMADKLPKIEDAKNADDYGVKVQNALFKTIVDVNQKRIAGNLPPKTLKEIFYEDFKAPERDVPGADAPINMARGGYTPDTETEELDYVRDLRNKSFRQLATEMTRKALGK